MKQMVVPETSLSVNSEIEDMAVLLDNSQDNPRDDGSIRSSCRHYYNDEEHEVIFKNSDAVLPDPQYDGLGHLDIVAVTRKRAPYSARASPV